MLWEVFRILRSWLLTPQGHGTSVTQREAEAILTHANSLGVVATTSSSQRLISSPRSFLPLQRAYLKLALRLYTAGGVGCGPGPIMLPRLVHALPIGRSAFLPLGGTFATRSEGFHALNFQPPMWLRSLLKRSVVSASLCVDPLLRHASTVLLLAESSRGQLRRAARTGQPYTLVAAKTSSQGAAAGNGSAQEGDSDMSLPVAAVEYTNRDELADASRGMQWSTRQTAQRKDNNGNPIPPDNWTELLPKRPLMTESESEEEEGLVAIPLPRTRVEGEAMPNPSQPVVGRPLRTEQDASFVSWVKASYDKLPDVESTPPASGKRALSKAALRAARAAKASLPEATVDLRRWGTSSGALRALDTMLRTDWEALAGYFWLPTACKLVIAGLDIGGSPLSACGFYADTSSPSSSAEDAAAGEEAHGKEEGDVDMSNGGSKNNGHRTGRSASEFVQRVEEYQRRCAAAAASAPLLALNGLVEVSLIADELSPTLWNDLFRAGWSHLDHKGREYLAPYAKALLLRDFHQHQLLGNPLISAHTLSGVVLHTVPFHRVSHYPSFPAIPEPRMAFSASNLVRAYPAALPQVGCGGAGGDAYRGFWVTNVVQALLWSMDGAEGLEMLPEALRYVGKTYGCWSMAEISLQRGLLKASNPVPFLNPLAEVLAGIGDEDVLRALRRRFVVCPETVRALDFEAHGLWQQAQTLLMAAMRRAHDDFTSNPPPPTNTRSGDRVKALSMEEAKKRQRVESKEPKEESILTPAASFGGKKRRLFWQGGGANQRRMVDAIVNGVRRSKVSYDSNVELDEFLAAAEKQDQPKKSRRTGKTKVEEEKEGGEGGTEEAAGGEAPAPTTSVPSTAVSSSATSATVSSTAITTASAAIAVSTSVSSSTVPATTTTAISALPSAASSSAVAAPSGAGTSAGAASSAAPASVPAVGSKRKAPSESKHFEWALTVFGRRDKDDVPESVKSLASILSSLSTYVRPDAKMATNERGEWELMYPSLEGPKMFKTPLPGILPANAPASARLLQELEVEKCMPQQPTPKVTSYEVGVWEERWVQSARQLCQWPVLRSYAQSAGDHLLHAEARSKLGDWENLNELLKAPSVALEMQRTAGAKLHEVEVAMNLRHQTRETLALCEQASVLLLRQWASLPRHHSTMAHEHLLATAQRVMEAKEAGLVDNTIRSLAQSRRMPDLKGLLQSWRERLPNRWDGIAVWDSLLTWRHHVFSYVTNALQHTVNGDPSTLTQVHDAPWTVIRLAHTARKLRLPEVCETTLARLCKVTTMEVNDAFTKLREQVMQRHWPLCAPAPYTAHSFGLCYVCFLYHRSRCTCPSPASALLD